MIDVSANRRARKWSSSELLGRVAWALAHPLFAWSPRPLWAWRRMVLRMFGARIGREVHVYPTVRIAIPWNVSVGDQSAIGDRVLLYSLGRIEIGCRSTVSHNAHLCAGTHDHDRADFPLIKAPIVIGDDVWIAADAFIGPNVAVGDGAIVGARAVVVRSVSPQCVVVGNPARIIGNRTVLETEPPL